MGLPLLSTLMLVPCQFILCSVADLNPRRYSGTAVLLMHSDPILKTRFIDLLQYFDTVPVLYV